MSGIMDSFAKLPPVVKALVIAGSLVSFGFTLGATTTGMLSLPMVVEENTVKNASQDSMHVRYESTLREHERRMNSVDERLDRIACFMTARESGASVFACR